MPAQPLISLCLPNPVYNNDRIAKTVYIQTLNIVSQNLRPYQQSHNRCLRYGCSSDLSYLRAAAALTMVQSGARSVPQCAKCVTVTSSQSAQRGISGPIREYHYVHQAK